MKDSTFCAAHEKIFQRAETHWEALVEMNKFMGLKLARKKMVVYL
jgi:stress-induced morphogen